MDRQRQSPEPETPRRGSSGLLWVVIAVLGIAVVAMLLTGGDGGAESADEIVQLLTLLLVLVLAVGSFSYFGRTMGWSGALRNLLTWGVIIGFVALSFPLVRPYLPERFQEGGREAAMMAPLRTPVVGEDGRVQISAGPGGHFVLRAEVLGPEADAEPVGVRLLVDTGATKVVLTPQDAKRLGFDLSTLAFTERYQTANGIVRGAPVIIPEIRIGGVTMRDVEASVNEVRMSQSLLGMSYLSRLRGWQVAGNVLTLEPTR